MDHEFRYATVCGFDLDLLDVNQQCTIAAYKVELDELTQAMQQCVKPTLPSSSLDNTGPPTTATSAPILRTSVKSRTDSPFGPDNVEARV